MVGKKAEESTRPKPLRSLGSTERNLHGKKHGVRRESGFVMLSDGVSGGRDH